MHHGLEVRGLVNSRVKFQGDSADSKRSRRDIGEDGLLERRA